jgi:hypothetical protein
MSATHLPRTLALTGAAVALTTTFAFAQPPSGRGMGRMGYDKATEVTVTGTVESVATQEMGFGQGRGAGMMMGGTHLMLKTATETLDVRLGPTRWLADQKFEIAKGDTLQIVGSTITFNGAKALIAREITKGDRTLTLRNADGFPAWAGRGRRNQS